MRILTESGAAAQRARACFPQAAKAVPVFDADEDGLAILPRPPDVSGAGLRVAVLWKDSLGFPRWFDGVLEPSRLAQNPVEIRLPELSKVRVRLVGDDGLVIPHAAVVVEAYMSLPSEDPAMVAFCCMSGGGPGSVVLTTDDVGECELMGVSEALTLKFNFHLPRHEVQAFAEIETDLMPRELPGLYLAKPAGRYFVRVTKHEMPLFEILVRDVAGLPVRNVHVGFYLEGPPLGWNDPLHTQASGETDDAGVERVRLAWRSIKPEQLEGCRYWTVAFSPGHGASYSTGLLSLTSLRASLVLTEEKNLEVKARVISEETGEPVPGLELDLEPFFAKQRIVRIRTDATGYFVIPLIQAHPEDWRPPDCTERALRWKLDLATDSGFEFSEDEGVHTVGLSFEQDATYRVRRKK
ncbi:MAG: hypothetical protein HYY18_22400 [Planctomycetes bacterium]|nr:hypothetical protein [Planctomycetota bacterium]